MLPEIVKMLAIKAKLWRPSPHHNESMLPATPWIEAVATSTNGLSQWNRQ
jgi:hypothetical protein